MDQMGLSQCFGWAPKHKAQLFQVRSALRTQVLQLLLKTLSCIHGLFGGVEKDRDEIF